MIYRINFRNKMKIIRCYNRTILIPNFNRNCFLFQEFNQTLQSISDYKVKMLEKLWNYTINYSSRTKLQSHWFLQQHPEAKIHELKQPEFSETLWTMKNFAPLVDNFDRVTIAPTCIVLVDYKAFGFKGDESTTLSVPPSSVGTRGMREWRTSVINGR